MVRRRVFVRTVVCAAVCGGSLVAGSVSAGGGPSPTPTPTPPRGPVSVPALPYDFNGDGYPELVIGQPGGVWVVPGSWRGPSLTTSTVWTASSPGLLPGGGGLNLAYASGDFDRDGYADLAASTMDTGAWDSGTFQAGAVRVLYGSASGLTSARNQVWWQDTPGIADDPEEDDWFGGGLAVGDLDDDGVDDLVIGAPGEGVGSMADGAGAFHVIYGSTSGLTASGSQMWTQNSGGVPDVAETWDYFGGSIVVADVTADGVDDVVIGIPNESVGTAQNAGAVMVLPGSQAGVTSQGAQMWTQDSPGVATSVMEDDRFGGGIAIGNFGGGPELELAVSAVGEQLIEWPGSSSDPPSGAIVHELLGTPSGLTGLGSRTWNQATPGIAESPEPHETFGQELASGDMNGDGFDDLVVTVNEYLGGVTPTPGSPVHGAVHVIYGSSGGLVITGSQFWHQDVAGVPGVSTADDNFARFIQVVDLDRDGRAELLAGSDWDGAPYQRSEVEYAGTVNLFRGSSAGLTTTGAQLWFRGAYGLPGPPVYGSGFGRLGS